MAGYRRLQAQSGRKAFASGGRATGPESGSQDVSRAEMGAETSPTGPSSRKRGDRAPKAAGKTNINIIVNGKGADLPIGGPGMPPPGAPVLPPMPPPGMIPGGPPPGPVAGPPMPPPMPQGALPPDAGGPPPGLPPQMNAGGRIGRNRGGRV